MTKKFAVVEYTEPLGKLGHSIALDRSMINPFPNSAPLMQLQRLRPLTNFTILGPAAGSFTSFGFAVWPLIQADAVFQELVKQFKGIRCDITLNFLQRAAPMMYGMYTISFKYGSNYVNGMFAGLDNRWFGVGERLSSPTSIVDIGSSAAVDLIIPYRHNMNYLHPKPGLDSDYVYVSVINHMSIMDGSTDPLILDVLYSLSNIDCGFYTSDYAVDPQSLNQSYTDAYANELACKVSEIICDHAVDGLQMTIQELPEGDGYVISYHVGEKDDAWFDYVVLGPVEPQANVILEYADEFVGVASTVASGTAKFLKATDILGSAYGSLRDAYTDYFDPVVVNVKKDEPDSSSTVKSSDPSFGNAVPNMRPSTFGNMSGTGCCPTVGFLTGYESRAVTHMPGMKTEFNLRELAMIPGWIKSFQFNSTQGRNMQVVIPVCLTNVGLNQTQTEYTWASYFARYFRFYRGDHKYVLSWNTSPLIACRVQVALQYFIETTPNSLTVAPTSFASNEMPTQQYLIKGSCTKEIVVPWHSLMPMKQANDIIALLTITLLQPPNMMGIEESFVNCMVTHSLQNSHFYSIQTPHNPDPDLPAPIIGSFERTVPVAEEYALKRQKKLEAKYLDIRVEKQADLRLMHATPSGEFQFTGHAVDIMAHLEETRDLYSLFRRFDDDNDYGSLTTQPYERHNSTLRTPTTKDLWNRSSIVEQATMPFLFYVGGLEEKLFYKTAMPAQGVFVALDRDFNNIHRTGDGVVYNDTTVTPVFEFLIPYLASSPVFYRSPGPSMSIPETIGYDISPIFSITMPDAAYVRGACDFAVYYPNCLPDASLWLPIGVPHS
jgi:hypothetical protein